MTQQQEACNAYIRLLKQHEPELRPEFLALARESFNEGWQQRDQRGSERL